MSEPIVERQPDTVTAPEPVVAVEPAPPAPPAPRNPEPPPEPEAEVDSDPPRDLTARADRETGPIPELVAEPEPGPEPAAEPEQEPAAAIEPDSDLWLDRAPDAEPEPAPASAPLVAPVAAPRHASVSPKAVDPDGDDEWFDLPPERTGHKWASVVIVMVLIIGAFVGGGYVWYQRQVDPPGAPGAAISVEVPPGSSTSGIGSILEDKGVIANATVFGFYAGRKGAGPFEAGIYQLRENSSLDLVLTTMAKGPTSPTPEASVKVTIPEGYTVKQILDRIHQKVPRITVAEMQAALDQHKVPSALLPAGSTSYEGVLFPATYAVGSKTTGVQLLTQMADEMETRMAAVGIDSSRARIRAEWGLDLSAYDMLKVASMIQYEAAGPADAAKIGAVTYNRLKAGMPLQYDSTSIYEATLKGQDPAKIDYTVATPFNTRTNTGLPPTPISSPGEYAIDGAMQPLTGPWLYFVLTDTKQVTFTVTYDDFLAAKALCKQRGLGCG